MRPALKPLGWSIILYAFANSYYGVGALKNAFGNSGAFPAAERFLVFSVGAFWALYFISGVGALLCRQWSRAVLQCASAGSFAVITTGIILFVRPGGFNFSPPLLFTFARPVPELCIFLWSIYALPSYFRKSAAATGLNRSATERPHMRTIGLTVLATGALLPWLVGLGLKFIAGGLNGPLIAFSLKGILVSLFLTLWFAIPFVILLLILKAWAHTDDIKTSGARNCIWFWSSVAGTVLASIYVFIVMWQPQFESFLLAISPPFIFAGTAVGICSGEVVSKLFKRLNKSAG